MATDLSGARPGATQVPSVGVDVRLLGPVCVLVDGAPAGIGGRKQRAVLAVLAGAANTALGVTAIANATWEDNPPPTFASIVQVYVSNLRRALPPSADGVRALIESIAGGYRLNLPEDRLDVARFRELRAAGSRLRAAGRHSLAAGAFREALAQWQGEALADLQELMFAQELATVLHEERLRVLEERIGADIACGRHGEVIGELNALVREHPLREPLWTQLISALYNDGRQADALDAFRRIRGLLAEELGLDPSPPLRELEARILRQEPLTAPPTSIDASPAAAARTLHESGFMRRAAFEAASGTVTIGPAGLRIGRMPDNDFVLSDAKASRYHATVTLTPDGFVLADLHSTNGTTVNGVRLDGDRLLFDGDEVLIGAERLVFRNSDRG